MNVFTLLTNWRSSRFDSVSTQYRCRVLATLLLCLTLGVGNAWGTDYTMYNGTSFNSSWSKTSRAVTTTYASGYSVQIMGENKGTYGEIWSNITFTGVTAISINATASNAQSLTLYYSANGSSWTAIATTTSISKNSSSYSDYNVSITGLPSTAVYLKFRSSGNSVYIKTISITTSTSYTLTFKEWDGGGAASGSPSTGSVTANATSFSFGATAPSKTGHTIEGFYTNTSASSGVKVANSSRQFVASVASWTNASSQYTKGANANLYIKWQADEYTISTDLTNISVNTAFPSSVSYTGSATDALDRTLSVTSSYALPSDLTVTMGGNACTKGTEYSYNSSTGAFSFDVAITGDISISGSAIPYRTITFNDNGSTTVETWLEGSSHATPTITGCTGYDPLGWTTTAPTSNSWASQPSYTTGGNNITVPSSNTTYYAVYTTEGTTPINKFKRVTSSSDLISGEKYVITNTAETYALACNTFYTDKSFPTVSVSPSSGIITTDADKLIYAITGNNTSGYSIYSEEDGGTGIGYDNSEGVLAWYSNGPADWLITVGESNAVYIQAKKATTKYLQYSSSYYWLLTTETANHLFRQMYNTLYVSNPTCCTPLGTINGSVLGRNR